MSTDETDDGPDDGPDDAPGGAEADGAEGGGPPGEGGRRRRRRRRRRDRGPEGAVAAPASGDTATVPTQPPASAPPRRDDGRERRQWQRRPGVQGTNTAPGASADTAPGASADTAPGASADPASTPGPEGVTTRDERGRANRPPPDTVTTRDERARHDRGRGRDGGRGGRDGGRGDRGRSERGRGEQGRGEQVRGERTDRGERPADRAAEIVATPYEAPTARLQQQARRPSPADDADEVPETPAEKWGVDDDGPVKEVALAADLPADAPADDLDPATHHLLAAPAEKLGEDVVNVVGVRFVIGGRIQWCDASDVDYGKGERVVVDSDRGPRLATVAARPQRRATRDRGLRRVIRRANEADLAGERTGDTERARLLRLAKDTAAQLRLPLKVYRIESGGGKLNVYYTSDERLDLRDLVRLLGNASQQRIELRQLGVRDEAKAVGGIGSCGLTLCCTTWLPDFVPVSIKMAKDQGLVLSPTKVSGQCGRLKCCLVYEQAGYAELRKGLPKLGKRVISPRGEGRVVEVDVLRQRVRVSYGMGDNEVLPASEVKPLFPPGNQPPQARGPRPDRRPGGPERDDDRDDDDEADEADGKLPIDDALLGGVEDDDLGPTDDPSSDNYKPE
ncbi:MAG: hypothetical protein JNL83_40020 [Myxococcales bacterium]|nr:hypothetical protein [Myxococcales bacterium]